MSPIRGISEKVLLPRLGKIRLGVKVEGEKTYPKAVDYFVCPPEVQKLYGEKPKELRVMFPTEDPEQWASQYYRAYSQTRGLVCKGDGVTCMALVDRATGEVVGRETASTALQEMDCDPENCERLLKKQCRPVMNLQFLLPEVPGLGIWQLDTSSFHSIRNINSSVALIKGLLGRISMISLQLRVVPLEVAPDGKKKNVYVLELVAPYTLTQVLADIKSLPAGQALLPAPDAEAPDDLFPPDVLEEDKGSVVQQAADVAAKAEQAKPVEPAKPVSPAKPVPAATPPPDDGLWAGMTKPAPASAPAPVPAPAPKPRPDDGHPMTDPQKRAIISMAKKLGYTDSDLKELISRRCSGSSLDRLTKGQAALIIEVMQQPQGPPEGA